MSHHNWNAIYCTDCGKAIMFTPYPLPLQYHPLTSNCPTYCYQCAHSHAEAAGYMTPIGSGLSINALYEVDNFGATELCKAKFNKVWRPLCKSIQQYMVAKKINS